MHISPEHILPQDMVDILDKDENVVLRMHVSDAKHAMNVEPKRYVVANEAAAAKPVTEPEVEIVEDENEVEY
jgi:hypothetical protein